MDQFKATPSITSVQADAIRDAVLSAASDGHDATGLAALLIAEFKAIKEAEAAATFDVSTLTALELRALRATSGA